jgi:CTP:molybdopterin cytidylyltransferase MocA
MTSPPRIGCAILAAGATLLGERNAQLNVLNGQTLVERVTLASCRSRVARTAVIVSSRADDVATAVSNLPVDIISNPLLRSGLAAAVRSAVGWARGRHYDGLLLCVVDELALSTPLLDALIVASNGAQQLVGAQHDGVLGFPALFPRDCHGHLEELEADIDPRALVQSADPDFPILTVEVPRAEALAGALQLPREWAANDVLRGT